MTRLQFLQQQKQWALNWLSKPESELPGTLTHAKVAKVLDDTEDELIDHLGITLNRKGDYVACHIE